MALKLDTSDLNRGVDTKATNQKLFYDMKGDTRATFGAVRAGVKGKWRDGVVIQALKQINAKLDALYVAVRVGVDNKYPDGSLARHIRNMRNDILNVTATKAEVAELNTKLDRIINKIGA